MKHLIFTPPLPQALAAAGYQTPTPIQARAIPQVIKGHDVMGLAQTGTGKTAAFVLPILHRLVKHKYGGVRALIIAPTRELAEQIHQAIETLGRKTRLRSIACLRRRWYQSAASETEACRYSSCLPRTAS